MREGYRNELKAIKAEVVDIGRLVIEMTRDATVSLVEGDVDLAERVIAADDQVDVRVLALEERTLETIATQFPVARDLRLLYSLAHVNIHMERMADLAVNISKATRRTAERTGPRTMYDLIRAQGNLVHRVLEAMLEAFETNDLELAYKLKEMDEPIDHLFKQFFRELSRLQEEDEIEWASSMVLASRYLERIADHAVDIGERLVYMVTGEFEAFDESVTDEGEPPAT
ncbi:MAG: phosphate signaling complex protein PhoU [Coriobacteriia bacterium]|nr:phosphate signaling complex protein PhoU [Coriobacteriia bacterium]MBN2841112.1 phosphate signaling complex protein PhoU [Coriobacteriia bacterium]